MATPPPAQGDPTPVPSTPADSTPWIWKDGEFLPWADAQIHVMSHVVHYGSSIFEGIRFYETPEGASIFRLADHMSRFYDSCRTYRMTPSISEAESVEACRELVRRNGISEGYLRPLALRGVGARGLHPGASPVSTYLIAWPWGQYLGAEALEKGIDACLSSWNRPAPNTHPSGAKAGGNYLNSSLMKMEAVENGYAEAIALGPNGLLSEGSGQNLFLVKNNTLLTPALDGTQLDGLTRDTVIRLAQDMGIAVREGSLPRESLYTCDEAFFTGTASEITPIRSVDRIPIKGGVGPITRSLQDAYLGLVRGTAPDPYGWRDVVRIRSGESAA